MCCGVRRNLIRNARVECLRVTTISHVKWSPPAAAAINLRHGEKCAKTSSEQFDSAIEINLPRCTAGILVRPCGRHFSQLINVRANPPRSFKVVSAPPPPSSPSSSSQFSSSSANDSNTINSAFQSKRKRRGAIDPFFSLPRPLY